MLISIMNIPSKIYLLNLFQMAFSLKGCLPPTLLFYNREQWSIKKCLPSKVVFFKKLSFLKGCNPLTLSISGCLTNRNEKIQQTRKFAIWKSDFSFRKGPPKLNRDTQNALVFCIRTVMDIHEKSMNLNMCQLGKILSNIRISGWGGRSVPPRS